MEHHGRNKCLFGNHFFPKLLGKSISPGSTNAIFGHATCLGKWDICMFQAEVIERTCSRTICPQKKDKCKKQVLQSTYTLKSEAKSSQLTGRLIILNTHCYIPLEMGLLVMQQYADQYKHPLYVPHFARY